ncbi:bicaudal D-related protein homolog [Lucilia cuprina]|uniref:bicaudal D-related protein homolog n=1 Tax=Lucilia cuprina TaxID=7375 RepID=UPI001F058944|nr:bicaudal D-related protein homolog [Lucilia cuprina]
MHKNKLNNLTTNNNTTTAFNTSTTTSTSLSPNSSTTSSSSLSSLNNTTTDDLQHSLQSHQRHHQRPQHSHHQHRQHQFKPQQQQLQQTSTSILNSSIASIDLEQYIEAMEARSTASERNPETDVWAQLQQKESDILLAAELGQALLEENQELKKKLEKEIKENSAKIEVSKILNYILNIQFFKM